MPEQSDIYNYYTNLLDDAVENQDDYADTIPTLQYYSDKINQPNESPDRDYSYYEQEAKGQALADVQGSREDPDLYGFIPGDWLSDWVKDGYNNSIEGLGYQIATGRQFYDLSGYDESNKGILEDIGSTIISFMTPTDIAALTFGGGIGGLAAKASLKTAATGVVKAGLGAGIKKGLARETVEKLVEKNAVKATQLLMKNNIKKDVAEKVIADATKKVSNKMYAEVAQGTTGLGFYSGLQSALGQEVSEGDINAVTVLKDATKGAALGALPAATAKPIVNKILGSNINKTTKAMAVKAVETTEFGIATPVLYEGRAPRPEDFAHAAGVIGGLTIAKAVPKNIKKLTGTEKPLLTTKEYTGELGKAQFGMERKEQIFTSKDGTQISEVKFEKMESKGETTDRVKGKLVVDGEVTGKEITMSGSDFINQGFARDRSHLDLKGIETGRRREAFGRKKKLKLSDEEFRAEVEGVTGKKVDPKKHKTGWSQLSQIEQIKFLDNLRKQSLSDKIFKEFKSEGYEDYLHTSSKLSKAIPDWLKQAKNRAKTQAGQQTVLDINRADARGITLTGTYLQALANNGLYKGGIFSKAFGKYSPNIFKVQIKKGKPAKRIWNENQAKKYYEDLGRRMGLEGHQGDLDVKAIRKTMDTVYSNAKKAGVPVAEYRKNYFPNHVKQEFLDKIGQDVFKVIHEDASFAGTRMGQDAMSMKKLQNLLKSDKSNFSKETLEAMDHLSKEFKKQGASPDQAMARAWMELRNTVYKQRYSIVGKLERSRKAKLPEIFYERDARLVLSKYVADVAKRTAQVEFFGDKGQVIEQRLTALKKLRGQTSDPKRKQILSQEMKFLDQLYDSHTNQIEVDPTKNWGDPRARKAFKDLVDFEVGTKIGLGYATIPNVTQTLISTAVKAGYYNTFKGAIKLANPLESGKKYRNDVKKSGISNLSVFQMLSGLEPSGSIMGKFANLTTTISGFQHMNKANQYISAAAGKEYVASLMKAKDSSIGFRRNWAEKGLRDLDINPNTKTLTERQTLESMYRFSRDSQLQRNVLNDPLFFNDPRFRPFILFKRFGYKQFNWIRENLSQEFARGNLLPILRLGVGGAFGAQFVVWSKKALNNFLAGEEVYDENRLFLPGLPKGTILDDMGGDINTDMSEYTWSDFFDHVGSVGAFGFVSDITASENKFRALEFLFKPAIIQDGMKAVDALQRMYKDMEDYGMGAGKRAAKYLLPIFGTVPRRLAKRLETRGQRETYTTYRRGIIRSRVLDALISGNDKEAFKLVDAWNRANPHKAFYLEDIGIDAIYERLKTKAEKRAKP